MSRRVAVLASILQGDSSLATCDCGSSNVQAGVEGVQHQGETVVYTCADCGVAWAQTKDAA